MSPRAWWLLLTTNQKVVLQLLLGLLLFATGWQLGRVMSPYYAAHPIVFEEHGSEAGGNPEELVELLEEGTIESPKLKAQNPKPGEWASGEVAGAVTQGRFVGSKNSNKYHAVPECSSWKQIKAANQVWFADQAAAEAAGYVPTKCTAELL